MPSAYLGQAEVGATFMRDLVRDELVRQQQPTVLQSWFNNTWVLVGLLALVVGTIAWFSLRRQTPEERFQAGAELMERNPPAWQIAKTKYFSPLIEADPETWTDRVQPYLDDIEAFELESTLTPPRPRGKLRQVRTEPERMLVLVRADWERGDYAAAHRKLASLSVLLTGDAEAKPLLAVVQTWQAALDEQQAAQPDRRAFVELLLKKAESLPPDATAGEIAAAVVDLYADDPAVSDLVDRARRIVDQSASDR